MPFFAARHGLPGLSASHSVAQLMPRGVILLFLLPVPTNLTCYKPQPDLQWAATLGGQQPACSSRMIGVGEVTGKGYQLCFLPLRHATLSAHLPTSPSQHPHPSKPSHAYPHLHPLPRPPISDSLVSRVNQCWAAPSRSSIHCPQHTFPSPHHTIHTPKHPHACQLTPPPPGPSKNYSLASGIHQCRGAPSRSSIQRSQ